jgi:hypothetical protein
MAKDAIYTGTREVKTFVDINHGADVLIRKSEEQELGRYHLVMSALLLTAFTFEAYLNHLGERKIPFWGEIDSIKVLSKYAVLCKQFAIFPDSSKRPYQTLTSLFRFRNAIAHGKSRVLNETKEVSAQSDPFDHRPKTDWEEYCTLENAKRAKVDVCAIVEELHIAAGEGRAPFMSGMTIGTIQIKP